MGWGDFTSLTTFTDWTAPNGPNNCHNTFSSVSGARLYTKMHQPEALIAFPGSMAFASKSFPVNGEYRLRFDYKRSAFNNNNDFKMYIESHLKRPPGPGPLGCWWSGWCWWWPNRRAVCGVRYAASGDSDLLLLGLLANLTFIGSVDPFGTVPFRSLMARSASVRWSNRMNPTPFESPL